MHPLILGLLVGAGFGAILSLSGLSSPLRILDMLRLRDLALVKLLLVAIGTGIVGIALLDAGGLAHTSIKTLHVLALISGGAIFGLGFAVAGYCPGTALAGAAEGRRDAFLVVAGGLVGAAAYATAYASLAPFLIQPFTYGKPTVPSWLGVHALAVALPVGALVAWLAWRWRKSELPAEPTRLARGRPAH